MSSTAKIAEFINGTGLYQERARKALPLLVRQAEAGEKIFYSALADEMGMPNPRNLNYPLGSIGRTLEQLSKKWKEPIPKIQSLVVSKTTGLPGDGIGWFLIKKRDFESLPKSKKREIVKGELSRVFAFPGWRRVLDELKLEPASPDFSRQIEAAANMRGGGEREDHRRLKDFVAKHPELIGLPKTTDPGTIEYRLPSGDSADVLFRLADEWIVAEVKPTGSGIVDVTRGLFQCIKYAAVVEAVQAAGGEIRNGRAVLVLAGKLPPELTPLKNILGIEVFELARS